MPKNFKRGMLVTVLAGLALPSISFAQTEGLIEEVVVTATKRAKTLQEIPVAVTVTSADVIEKAQILDISDLQSVVPSLRVSQLQSSINTNFVIRGFGNGANNPGIEPSVAVFIDGVYRSRSASAISDLPSLERVEVLRGPQSTLFGKNASAGVISVVTRKPTGESIGKVSGTLGNFGQVVLKGEIEGAISDTAAFALSAGTNTRDGYAENLVTGTDINSRDRQNIRGQLLLNPNDKTEIRLIADFDTIDEECCATVNLVVGPTFPAILGAGGNIVANEPEALSLFTNTDPINEQDNAGVSAQVDYDFENFTLTSISSFRNLDSFYSIDADFTSADAIQNNITNDIDTFTQEVRLTSNGSGNFDWQVGAFYFDESVDFGNQLAFGPGFRPYVNGLVQGAGAQAGAAQAIAAGLPPQFIPAAAAAGAAAALGDFAALEAAIGLPFFAAGPGVVLESTLENEAISLFGQFDFHINDNLTATVGLNYTKDEKQATVNQSINDVFSSVDLVQVGFAQAFSQVTGLAPTPGNIAATPPQVLAALQAAAADPAQNPALGLRALQFLPPFQNTPNAIEDGETDDDDLTYTLRLAYDVNDNLNFYGSYATGFKASSINLSRDARPSASDFAAIRAAGIAVPNLTSGTRLAGPEEAKVFELGLKARFARGTFNLAVFDQTIEGFQSNVFAGTAFNLVNAGEQSTTGFEFDLAYYPTDALQLTLAGTYLDPTYDSFTTGEGPNGPEDLSGQQPSGINEVSLSASATYRFSLAAYDAYIRADYFYEDEVQVADNIFASIASRETKNLNVAAGLTTDNGLSFAIWARNLTDHASLISAFPGVAQSGTFNGYRTQPRTYGVTITKDF